MQEEVEELGVTVKIFTSRCGNTSKAFAIRWIPRLYRSVSGLERRKKVTERMEEARENCKRNDA